MVKVKRIMRCKKCGGTNFSFRWEYDKDEEMNLYLFNDGFGFRLEDAIVKCESCGTESLYEEEDFIETDIEGDEDV